MLNYNFVILVGLMSDIIYRQNTEVLKNITNTGISLSKMDSQIQSPFQETQMQNAEINFNSPTNVFDPGITENPEGNVHMRLFLTFNTSNWPYLSRIFFAHLFRVISLHVFNTFQ